MAQSDIIQALQRIEAALAQLVPPADVRAHFAGSEATAEQVDALATQGPVQGAQLDAITAWIAARMSGDQLQFNFDDLVFVTRQLTSINEGWRSDLLSMRGEIRRLSALCEQALRARVEDEARGIVWSGEERRRS